MITAREIRAGFIDFFKDKDHEFVPSSALVPINDDTLLFANAGMNQFKDIFTGLLSPEYRRVVNSQKCLRVSGKHNDLEQVGKDTYHHTFFEMLGNWSFDDYFKAEAIEWAWELLTKVWGIEPGRLWATVFQGDAEDGLPDDTEAKRLWPKVTGIPEERVLFGGKKDNFWEMGGAGPCGPCSEIHIDLGPGSCDMKNIAGHKCAVNSGCARYIELWNLVFIQFNRQSGGELVPLSANYVDTGAGLERIVAVLQNKKSNYDTDLFMPIINTLGDITGCKYTSRINNKTDNAFRVISDHIRSLVFAITDGAAPSNEGRGYVIRRILRRACRFGRELGLHGPFLNKLVPAVVDTMGDAFGEIKQKADYVSTVIESEEASFGRTLDRGIEIFNDAAKRAEKSKDRTIKGADAFQLYDTYGFPLDLTQLMAKERNIGVDTAKFDELMEEQRQRARAAQKDTSMAAALTDVELPATEDLHKYGSDRCDSKIVGWIGTEGFKNQGRIVAGAETGIVLDKTCFYAEAGGQVGDCGHLESGQSQFIVENATKIANCVIHQGKVVKGSFAVGDKVKAIVSQKRRDSIKKNHTATHLLQWALQKVKGKSIAQQGSLVGPDYLRFDFTCPTALTGEEQKKVEHLVREKIAEDLPVACMVMPIDEAEKLGAMALFNEKYGSEVRVVAVGAKIADSGQRIPVAELADSKKLNAVKEAFSREFCGGTHVAKTGSIGGFKIIKEESISAGVRRITALTGSGLAAYLEERSEIVDKLSKMLKTTPETLVDRVKKLMDELKSEKKKTQNAIRNTQYDIMAEAKQLLKECEKIGETSVIISRVSTTSVEQARAAIDMLKKKAKSAVIVLGFAEPAPAKAGGKVTLLAGVTDDLVKKGLKAGDIVKQIAPIVEGGGGGRPQMAEAGGKKPEKIGEALSKAKQIIAQKLDIDATKSQRNRV